MATATSHESKTSTLASRAARKLWREVSRPIRRISRSANVATAVAETIELAPPRPAQSFLAGSGVGRIGTHPHLGSVEPLAITFIQQLVRESRRYAGPIIEVGTLLGVTTTNIALAKSPEQKIITVDNYCWNPWALSPDVHELLAATVLHYLIKTGQVEQIRMDKNEFFRGYAGPAPAMVFLDAVHDYPETKKDIEWAQRVGARIIAGHDYCDAFPGVKQVVDEFGGPRQQCASVWVL